MSDEFAMSMMVHKPERTTVKQYLERYGMPYSHRNGETEPPTEEGWYFLKQHGNAKRAANPSHPLVSVIVMNRVLTVWTWGNDTPVKDIKGKWWGPVTLPWEQEP